MILSKNMFPIFSYFFFSYFSHAYLTLYCLLWVYYYLLPIRITKKYRTPQKTLYFYILLQLATWYWHFLQYQRYLHESHTYLISYRLADQVTFFNQNKIQAVPHNTDGNLPRETRAKPLPTPTEYKSTELVTEAGSIPD